MAQRESATRWFLAQLKPNSARIAEKNLGRQGFRTFLPMKEGTRQRNGKFVTAVRPLFPGYIFVAFDPLHGLWQKINSTHGITQLVRLGKEPTEVPEDLILQLMDRCSADGTLQPSQSLLPGDNVTVTNGPFTNFVAEVENVEADKRIWVLMDIMGGKTRVALAADQLRPT